MQANFGITQVVKFEAHRSQKEKYAPNAPSQLVGLNDFKQPYHEKYGCPKTEPALWCQSHLVKQQQSAGHDKCGACVKGFFAAVPFTVHETSRFRVPRGGIWKPNRYCARKG